MSRQQRRSTLVSGAALVLAALAAVAGCEAGRPLRPAADTASPSQEAAAQAVLTINASSMRWDWYVGRAEQLLTARCMRTYGFQYIVPAQGPAPSTRTVTAFALGQGSPATYGVTPQSVSASSGPRVHGVSQHRYQLALEGAPDSTATMALPGGGGTIYETGGCVGFARTKLFGSVRAYVASSYIPQVVRNEQFGKFLRTYRPYLAALRAWRSCMKARAWAFAAPQAAIESVQAAVLENHISPAALARRQASIAGADTACDTRSGLRARMGQALARFTGSLPPKTLAQLAAVSRSRVLALAVARRVDSAPPPLRR